MEKLSSLLKLFKKRKYKLTKPSWFTTLDETRAPNVKQYLRGLRNYFLLSTEIKVIVIASKSCA